MDVIAVGLLRNLLLVALGVVVLYLVVRRAVRDGMLDAWRERPRDAALAASAERVPGGSHGEPGAPGRDG
jgi:hypothetical protein